MKLKELLNLITDENTPVSVCTNNFKTQLESYDGRDSLSHDYDECSVVGMRTATLYTDNSPTAFGVIVIDLNTEEAMRIYEFNGIIRKVEERDSIIFPNEWYDPSKYHGGIRTFDDLSPDKARTLFARGYLNMRSRHNASPEVIDFLDFIESTDNPEDWHLGGFVYSPERVNDSYGTLYMVVDEITCECSEKDISFSDIIDFVDEFRLADEFEVGKTYARAWWD